MFAEAYKIASNFTQPVLISTRKFDKTVECSVGSFVIINEEGWIVTAAHIFDAMLAHQQHAQELNAYQAEVQRIEQEPTVPPPIKSKKIARLTTNSQWITNYSYWWAADHHFIDPVHLLKDNDLAIGKLRNYNPQFCQNYPIFKKPTGLNLGTSLCKLGYPFYEVKTQFNESNNSFQLAPNTLPIPRFPMDGIFTREINRGKTTDGRYDIKFIETSSPGLRGQSGGAIFDVAGNIWAIQSTTAHIPLGFSPKVIIDKKEVVEHQFLNLGLGVHVETICQFLDNHGIKYRSSEQ